MYVLLHIISSYKYFLIVAVYLVYCALVWRCLQNLGETLRTIGETLHKKGDKSSRQGTLSALYLIVEGMDDEEYEEDLASCSEGVYW
jgi:hypothetical protein